MKKNQNTAIRSADVRQKADLPVKRLLKEFKFEPTVHCCTKAQWSVGVTKPIHEISNIQTNMNFLEAFGYIFIKKQVLGILMIFANLQIGAFCQFFVQNQGFMAEN